MRDLALGAYTQKDLTKKVNTIGDVTTLKTEAKTTAVGAINELKDNYEKIKNSIDTNTANFLIDQKLDPVKEDVKALHTQVDNYTINYKQPNDPTASINPTIDSATFLNTTTGVIWTCIDKTKNKNRWINGNGEVAGALPSNPNLGSVGFGVGIAPEEITNKYNMYPMLGTFTPGHMNYGNYTDIRGNVMVWIPKLYIKTSNVDAAPYYGLKVEVSATQESGFWCHRAFINNGEEIPGFFIDKYLASNQGGILGSRRNTVPLTCDVKFNSVALISGVSAKVALGNKITEDSDLNLDDLKSIKNRNSSFIEAVKNRGPEFQVLTVFAYNYLILLSKCIYQNAYNSNNFNNIEFAKSRTDRFAFIQGMNTMQTAQRDIQAIHNLDYKTAGYTDGTNVLYRTGSVSDSKMGKISHNGHACGVVDLVGGLFNLAIGAMYGYILDRSYFGVIKESTNITDLDLESLVDTNNYDETTLPAEIITYINSDSDSPLGYFKDVGAKYNNANVRTTSEYKIDSCGIPKWSVLQDATVDTTRQTFQWRGNPTYKDTLTFPIVGSSFKDSFYSSVQFQKDTQGVEFGTRCILLPEI